MSSLLMIVEDVRVRVNSAINQIIAETNIPAYLMEGVLQGALADVRAIKNSELYAEIRVEQSEPETQSEQSEPETQSEQSEPEMPKEDG